MMAIKQKIILALFVLAFLNANAQDVKYVRRQIERLCSPGFHGRAYYKRGDSLAADYLAQQLKGFGLNSFGSDYFQYYSFHVNSLEKATLKVNGEAMEFGKDFMMHPSSSSLKGHFKPLLVDATLMKSPARLSEELTEAGPHPFIVLDSSGLDNPELYRFVKTMTLRGQMEISGLMEICSALPIGRVGRSVYHGPCIYLTREAVPWGIEDIEIDVKNRYYQNYPTQNVIGFIPGRSEKVIVFTAHYDMLGSFGEGNYFPGASDNASGTAMVLDLARHFSRGKKPYFTVAFMLLSGEEAGLMGSTHYVNQPLFPLEKIKLVINLDMVGTGQEGVMLFNAPQRPLEASIVQKLNEEKGYMKEVTEVRARANSDHYPFHEKGIPAIFFLTKGRSGGGHNIFDTPDKLPLYGYENLFSLILDLIRELQLQETDQ